MNKKKPEKDVQTPETGSLEEILAAEFDSAEVHLKAQTVTKDEARCLAVAYLDARQVQERLNEAFGLTGWSVKHEVVDGLKAIVKTQLYVRKEDKTTSLYEDFGYSEGYESEPLKSAASDGLKRCAVNLGIGRYLYRLPKMWADYDPQTKQPKVKTLADFLHQPQPAAASGDLTTSPAGGAAQGRYCEKCGGQTMFLRTRTSQRTGKEYQRWECNAYPNCKNTTFDVPPEAAPMTEPLPPTDKTTLRLAKINEVLAYMKQTRSIGPSAVWKEFAAFLGREVNHPQDVTLDEVEAFAERMEMEAAEK